MELLDNVIQSYAWGSRSAIAALQGRSVPSEGPEAELWMGTHPLAPSKLVAGRSAKTLAELIANDPVATLGERTIARHGRTLPFLLKVLAADQPLSLQAHPNLTQAREGFAREEAARVARDAPQRSYKDANHKPELICALTPFDALCGFRSAADVLALFEALAVPALKPECAVLRTHGDSEGLRTVFSQLFARDRDARASLVDDVVKSAAKISEGPFARAFEWTRRFVELYPGDIGVVVSLMLRDVQLKPGEALYLPAGNLHAYVHGVGVEIMASSDNVLRGGLTPKHIDVDELMRVLDFREEAIPVVHARDDGNVHTYSTPAHEFELARIDATSAGVSLTPHGPEILLCIDGAATIEGLDGARVELPSGSSLFVPASHGDYTVRGVGTVYRAMIP